MSVFTGIPTPIAGVFVLERTRYEDSRGFLERVGDVGEIAAFVPGFVIRQVNRTFTREAGTVRGLHCQLPPSAEHKVVTCLQGAAFDVIVDLRGNSPTFGQWWGLRLDGNEFLSVLIPAGCAHGLQTLTDDVQMLYQHSIDFDAKREAGLCPLDARVAVEWPLPVTNMSRRDREERSSLEHFREIKW